MGTLHHCSRGHRFRVQSSKLGHLAKMADAISRSLYPSRKIGRASYIAFPKCPFFHDCSPQVVYVAPFLLFSPTFILVVPSPTYSSPYSFFLFPFHSYL